MAQRPVLTTIEVAHPAQRDPAGVPRRGRAGRAGAARGPRRTEAVLIPYDLWVRLEAAADDPELLADLTGEGT